MNFWNKLFGGAPAINYAALVLEGALVVDVRTPGEYNSGHIKGSVNIPLDRLQMQIPELKKSRKQSLPVAEVVIAVEWRKACSQLPV
jgi:rhodanese-related sulfurtransferase